MAPRSPMALPSNSLTLKPSFEQPEVSSVLLLEASPVHDYTQRLLVKLPTLPRLIPCVPGLKTLTMKLVQ